MRRKTQGSVRYVLYLFLLLLGCRRRRRDLELVRQVRARAVADLLPRRERLEVAGGSVSAELEISRTTLTGRPG
jgi:hypothetical protein